MSRFMQTVVSQEDYDEFTRFAFLHSPRLTISELIETAVKYYIETKRKEAGEATEANTSGKCDVEL